MNKPPFVSSQGNIIKQPSVSKLPVWFKQDIPDVSTKKMTAVLSEFNMHTVCQEARCPNLGYCFKRGHATFLILGDTCTRNCRFCAVKKTGSGDLVYDLEEPNRLAQVVGALNLNYVVITSVTRDDLEDGGARIFAQSIELVHKINKEIKVEVLIPDFQGNMESLKCLLAAQPQVVAHNIETVERLYVDLRLRASYQLSLGLLKKAKEIQPLVVTKSSIMLGLGERPDEVIKAMEDLLYSGCDILVLGQYLSPSDGHYPVKEFIDIELFQRYHDIGLGLGFKSVLSGPLMRSSYRADEAYNEALSS